MIKLRFLLTLPAAWCALAVHAQEGSRDGLGATLWQQRSAEYRALCYQAYNVARWRIDQLKPAKGTLRAIVVDVDETVLDNSPFQAHEIAKGISYNPADWLEWTARAAADTVPGAFSFLRYASSKGIAVFYITNRLRSEQEATLANLKKFGFPDADYRHFLGKEETSDKESRRRLVAKKYDIVMLFGDNLNDFNDLFYKKGEGERALAVETVRAEFGKRFIVLPNPMYGDWEAPLYGNAKNPSEAEKANLRLKALKGY